MARYIDADKLLEQVNSLEQLARKRVCDTPTNSPAYERYSTQYQEREKMLSILKSQPTADVVPRSEVEKIFEKLKRRECSNSVCAWCVHANAYGRRNEECDKPYIDKNGKKEKACYAYAKFESLIDNELADLKKKYTEEKDCRTCEHLVSCEPNTSGNFDCWEADSRGNL